MYWFPTGQTYYKVSSMEHSPAQDMLEALRGHTFGTVLADPPWRFTNRTGKMAPENRRLMRYPTLSTEDIMSLPVSQFMQEPSHCYLWVPNSFLPEGIQVLERWGFQYKTQIIWHKIRKDPENSDIDPDEPKKSDGRGVGFYFRNVTETILFGVRGKNARTLKMGRTQVNMIQSRKREHSRKPDEQYPLIEGCSWGPFLELFGRGKRKGWFVWGNQADDSYKPSWPTYAYNSTVPLGK